jgi:hypothetical protein
MSGGQAAVAALQAEQVRHVFGLIGSATMEMFDALYDASDIDFIGVHDERTGCRGNPCRSERAGRDQSRHRPGAGLRRVFAGGFDRWCALQRTCLP